MGGFILVSILLPRFIIAIVIVFVLYVMTAAFYRASARETKVRASKSSGFDVYAESRPKRLDAVLQSSLYSHFSESLSGIATIRTYGEEGRFLKENRDLVDRENRAYWLTVTNQVCSFLHSQICAKLWLNPEVAMARFTSRLPGNPAASFCVYAHRQHTVYCVSCEEWGDYLVPSLHTAGMHQCLCHADICSASCIQLFGWAVKLLAEIENNMNSVERIVHYTRDLEQEPPHEISESKPTASWPSKGELEIKNVFLKYRPELPPVLKGLSMTVKGGEKIGIVGRWVAFYFDLCVVKLMSFLPLGRVPGNHP